MCIYNNNASNSKYDYISQNYIQQFPAGLDYPKSKLVVVPSDLP